METRELVFGYAFHDEIRELFTEYTDMLVRESPEFKGYLDIQHYDDELLDLSVKYGLPEGRLYLLRINGAPAACVALRKLDGERCELKRLYVRPAYRNRGIARQLVHQLIADARSIGYRRMLLDTLPFLETAIRMYRQIGFYDIPCYNDSPMDCTVFLALDL